IFDAVSVKPGKPTTFAVSKDAICFGMPGNPVSTFVIFETIVKPFIMKMTGSDEQAKRIKMRLDTPFKRKKTERTEFIPVKINNDGKVEVVRYHGSGHLTSLIEADGIIKIEKGVNEISANSLIEVLFI
ncbi:MAG TPA: molybdopterin molybdenumtransferase MoeA, partial [bacterium]|nr:molybdopterin molybdenumtransferase MoeA [bacterium]